MGNAQSTSSASVVRLHPTDNVVVAAGRIPKGARIQSEDVVVTEAITSGHKIATAAIRQGETVRKYGQVIGVATQAIAPGNHVHVHNIAVSDLRADAYRSTTTRRTYPIARFRGIAGLMGGLACATTSASSQA